MPKKEIKIETKNLHVRTPKALDAELVKLAAKMGISKNSLCLEILRKGIIEIKKEILK